MNAIRYNSVEVVRRLLLQGADPNQVPRYGRDVDPRRGKTSPLILAAGVGDEKKIGLLLVFDANSSYVDFGSSGNRVGKSPPLGRQDLAEAPVS
jgi:hypothetical protein